MPEAAGICRLIHFTKAGILARLEQARLDRCDRSLDRRLLSPAVRVK